MWKTSTLSEHLVGSALGLERSESRGLESLLRLQLMVCSPSSYRKIFFNVDLLSADFSLMLLKSLCEQFEL